MIAHRPIADLPTHRVANQPPPLVDYNLFGTDPSLREALAREGAGWAAEQADRFGAAPDEIDTTPTNDKHVPGAPSAPVWSLKDDIPDTTPQEDDSKPKKKGWWQKAFGGE